MSFFVQEETKRDWYPDIFLKFQPGVAVKFQVLEPKITQKNVLWRHYLTMALRKSGQRGVPVTCPGSSVCPACLRNASLGDKNHKDYIPLRKSIVVNVLDLTQGRVCPICEVFNLASAKVCSGCGYVLDEVEAGPANKIKLLERGVTFFTQLNTIEETITVPYDPNGNFDHEIFDYSGARPGDMVPVGITRIPITVVSSKGTGTQIVYTPVPGQPNDLNWRDYQDKLIDPKAVYISLKPEEIEHLMAGGSLSEVLKGREVEDAL